MSMIITVTQGRSALSGLARCGIVFLAWTAFAINFAVPSEFLATPSDPPGLIQFLEQTIGWYRQLAVEQQIATEPNDAMVVHDNQQMANQVVELAFDFARAKTASTTKPAGSNQAAGESPGSSQYQALVEMAATLDKEVQDVQGEVESVKQKLATASGAKRQDLQSTLAETQSEVELAKARREAVRSMMEFVEGASLNGLGGAGRRAQIEALARSVPGALAKPATSKESGIRSTNPSALCPFPALTKRSPRGFGDWAPTFLHSLDESIRSMRRIS